MRSIHLLALASVLTFSCGNREGVALQDLARAAAAPSDTAPTDGRRFAVPIDDLPSMGARDALVTLVAFTDYDCAFCGKAEHTLAALRAKYGDDLRVVVAEHPLPVHPHARAAALAALAADASSSFEAMRPLLFANPDSRSPDDLAALAARVGISRSRYERALASDAPAALARAEALAASLHVKAAPTFFVNGRKLVGAQPLATFEALVDEELATARSLVATGTARNRVYDALLARARANPPAFDADDAPELVTASRGVGGAPFLGPDDAKSTIVLFTDFECPYCKRLDGKLRDLVAARRDVRVVLRNHPLPMHTHARLAAKAAIAANAQGKLAPFAAAMFAHQDALDRASLVALAGQLGLDGPRFEHDLDSSETATALAADEALAAKLDVEGTPTSFVEGRRVVGAQPVATFEAALAP